MTLTLRTLLIALLIVSTAHAAPGKRPGHAPRNTDPGGLVSTDPGGLVSTDGGGAFALTAPEAVRRTSDGVRFRVQIERRGASNARSATLRLFKREHGQPALVTTEVVRLGAQGRGVAEVTLPDGAGPGLPRLVPLAAPLPKQGLIVFFDVVPEEAGARTRAPASPSREARAYRLERQR